jgi:phospholipid/cholesterol/gamma-HCH transport system ATP-binding protein
MEIIRVRGLSVGYGETPVLENLDFDIPDGRVTVIVGESGSGKSTLLKTLIGLLPPLAGDVVLDGRPIDFRSEEDLRQLYARIGVLFQNSALLNSLSLYENIALPLRIHRPGQSPAEETKRVAEMLGRVGLTGSEKKFPYELSGGMRKRAAVARAMVLDPEIVFCDEPSAGLDPITATGIDSLLKDLCRAHGMTFVVVTHELRSIERIADQILLLRDGAVRFRGGLGDVAKTKDPYVRSFFLRTANHDH